MRRGRPLPQTLARCAASCLVSSSPQASELGFREAAPPCWSTRICSLATSSCRTPSPTRSSRTASSGRSRASGSSKDLLMWILVPIRLLRVAMKKVLMTRPSRLLTLLTPSAFRSNPLLTRNHLWLTLRSTLRTSLLCWSQRKQMNSRRVLRVPPSFFSASSRTFNSLLVRA